MPIDKQWATLYPSNWNAISAEVREDAGQCCEWCGVKNHSMRGATKIILTVAHLDHDPRNCERENLRALCQACHIGYDKTPEQRRRREMLRAELFGGQQRMF
jgi:5-methylcytosine-specific restriction endonuclease McrA